MLLAGGAGQQMQAACLCVSRSLSGSLNCGVHCANYGVWSAFRWSREALAFYRETGYGREIILQIHRRWLSYRLKRSSRMFQSFEVLERKDFGTHLVGPDQWFPSHRDSCPTKLFKQGYVYKDYHCNDVLKRLSHQ